MTFTIHKTYDAQLVDDYFLISTSFKNTNSNEELDTKGNYVKCSRTVEETTTQKVSVKSLENEKEKDKIPVSVTNANIRKKYAKKPKAD